MTKPLIPCQKCKTLHTRRGLRLAHGELLCYSCFLELTERIPGKYSKETKKVRSEGLKTSERAIK